MNLQDSKLANRLSKSILPQVSRLVMRTGAGSVMRYCELASCLVQGKGAGSGWDIGSEAAAAARFIGNQRPTLLDVGANIGNWARFMLSRFPRARLIMVEPQPACLESLRRIGPGDTSIATCAVSDAPGEMALYTARPAWEGASLFARRESYFADLAQNATTVPVRTLDDILADNTVETVDFLKLDIEGAELRALQGARQALERRTIAALSFEFGSANINSRTFFIDFWELLAGYGFAVWRIMPGGNLFRINSYYEDAEYFRGVTNYIASRHEPAG